MFIRFLDNLRGVEVVKVNAEYWIKNSVFKGFFKVLKTCQEVYVFCGSK
jgi:hypothetical protein